MPGAWDELVAFLKGTRPRPPRGPTSRAAFVLLVLATLAHLPLVYLLVAVDGLAPPIALSIGLLSMGLAWSGGCSLEGRRRGTVRALTMLGVAEAGLAFVPLLADALGAARWLFVAIGALCVAALFAQRRAGDDRSS